MKVILTEAFNKLGKIGDVIKVKDGYAKNFLIPKKKAISFSDNNLKTFESKRGEFEKLDRVNFENASKVKNKLIGKNLVILQNASDDGRLYGSVNSGVISNHINDLIKEKLVSRADIFLKKPIKEIGLYEFNLKMHSEVDIALKIAVARSESEAELLLNPELKKAKEEIANQTEQDSKPKKPARKSLAKARKKNEDQA